MNTLWVNFQLKLWGLESTPQQYTYHQWQTILSRPGYTHSSHISARLHLSSNSKLVCNSASIWSSWGDGRKKGDWGARNWPRHLATTSIWYDLIQAALPHCTLLNDIYSSCPHIFICERSSLFLGSKKDCSHFSDWEFWNFSERNLHVPGEVTAKMRFRHNHTFSVLQNVVTQPYFCLEISPAGNRICETLSSILSRYKGCEMFLSTSSPITNR